MDQLFKFIYQLKQNCMVIFAKTLLNIKRLNNRKNFYIQIMIIIIIIKLKSSI